MRFMPLLWIVFMDQQEYENTVTNGSGFSAERTRKTPGRKPGKIPGRL
jgi:hypothetical protein